MLPYIKYAIGYNDDGPGAADMAIFDTAKMSPDEFKFIRAYCRAVRDEFELLSIIFALQHPEELDVKCPFEAVKLARKVVAMRKEYTLKLAKCGARSTGKPAKSFVISTTPGLDDIGYIFTISFFKIVDATTKQVIPTTLGDPRHDGWSSGRPEEWQQTITSLYEIQKQQPKNEFNAGAAISKLFKLFSSFQHKKKLYLETYDDYVEEDDEDDDDEYYDQFF